MAATMSKLRRVNPFARIALATLVALTALVMCAAVPAPARAADDDPPSRVGRLAEVGGAVYLAPEDRTEAWAEVGQNYPVASGDNLWLQGEGRAEVDFGVGQLRLGSDTNVHVSRLDDHELSLFVAQGHAIVRLRTLEPGDVARIDTPNTQVALLRPGLYRIDVSEDRQETTLVVREGEATASAGNGVSQVLPGQTATLVGGPDVQVDVRNGSGIDGFDTYSASRDRFYRPSLTAEYVSPQMVGAADLDRYGQWQSYPEYGAVWFPSSVAPDWAPYSDGTWTTVSGWGLTWVDSAPWGYAPFHYGRWAFVGGRWGWCPGRYVARPVWAPALVAWYGGNSWGAGAGGPVYGWMPLGWRDPYVPSWRNCSARCWNNYNRPYAVNVAERPRQPPTVYANYRVPGAVTAMAGAAFVAGKPVAANRVRVPSTQLASAPVLNGAPQLKPLPVGTRVVRPGNGVPTPVSTALGTTKPLPMARPQPANAAAGAPAQPWGRPAPAYNAAERPAPPMSAPGATATGRPPAVAAAPPSSYPPPAKPQTANAAPPGGVAVPGTYANPPRYRAPETGQVVNRAEVPRAAPPAASQSIPLPPRLTPPPQIQPQPQIQAAPAAPRAVPQPQMQGAPVVPHVVPPPPQLQSVAPAPPPPAPRPAAEKPAVAKPQPGSNAN